jgi:putative DNA primase/helicase
MSIDNITDNPADVDIQTAVGVELDGDGRAKRPAKKRRSRPASVLSEDGIPSILLDEGRTELANAKRFVALHGAEVRYCPTMGWLVCKGTHWAVDDLAAEARAKDVARYVWRQLSVFGGEAGDRALGEIYRFAKATASAPGQRNLLKLTRSERGIPVTTDELNRDPWAWNCINGTLDLRTGELRPHRREDMLTQLCPTPYVPDAQCPTFLAFLRRIMQDNRDLIAFIQRAVGMSLTGVIRDHKLFVPYGKGQNGKSTLFGALLKTLGPDYAMKAPLGLLMAKQNEQHPCERADLFGKRLVVCIEVEEGQRLAESLVKELTGGDPIRARFQKKDFFEFWPTHHLFLCVNHKPTVRGTDTGIWRRLALTPFSVSISDKEKDRELPEKLQAEHAGILAWAVRGCLAWQREGLGEPAAVEEATSQYRQSQDTLARFIEECCIVAPNARARTGDLLKAYRKWSGNDHATQRWLGEALIEKGYGRHPSGGYVWRIGIGLKDEEL